MSFKYLCDHCGHLASEHHARMGGLVGTMYKGGFGEGFFVGLMVESAVAALVTVISIALWLLDVI